jgi:hypothetical protein
MVHWTSSFVNSSRKLMQQRASRRLGAAEFSSELEPTRLGLSVMCETAMETGEVEWRRFAVLRRDLGT